MAGGYGSLEPARLVDTPHRGSPDASVATELADPPALLRQSQHLRHGHPRLLLHPLPADICHAGYSPIRADIAPVIISLIGISLPRSPSTTARNSFATRATTPAQSPRVR